MKKASQKKKSVNVLLLVGSVVVFIMVFVGVVWALNNQSKFSIITDLLSRTGGSGGLGVTVVLSSEKAGKIVDKSGGTVVVNNATLDIPTKSVLSTSDVTLYTIESIGGLPTGAHFVTGVQIDSTEDVLYNPAALTITIPKESTGKNLRGVAYEKDGSNLHFFPIEIQDNTANFTLFHFSGYGIIAVDDPDMNLPEPSEARSLAELSLSTMMWQKTRRMATSDDEMTDKNYDGIRNILREWYSNGVKPKLEAAVTDDNAIIDAATEYVVWWQMVKAFLDDDELADLRREGQTLLAKGITNASTKAYQKCVDTLDATKAGRLLRLSQLSEVLVLDGITGIDINQIQSNTRKCANFELRITSRIEEMNDCGNDVTAASGTIPLSPDEGMILSGEGEVTTTEKTMCGAVCTASPRSEVNKAEVLGAQLVAAEKTEVSLLFKIGVAPRVNYRCLPKENFTLEGENVSYWLAWMGEMHFDELVEEVPEYSIIKLTDWEKVNADGVYAKKVYQRSRPVMGGTEMSEDTTFELVHTPK